MNKSAVIINILLSLTIVFVQYCKVGEIYHVDIFHAETRTCSSWFYLDIEDVQISNPSDLDYPPTDYHIKVAEDFHINGILQTIHLEDTFVTAPSFHLKLYQGNCCA